MLTAWLAQRFPQRLIVVMAPSPADAERWLSDLALLTDEPAALYPQREALGEDEPHYEIAGERAETLEALLSGRLRLLVTTARATAERTLVPAALERLTLALAPGERRGLSEVVGALETMGYRRVHTVTEVAEFSVRGGIVDVYGFGMAAPARVEWWGDEIASLRAFDLTSQRSGEELRGITVLPITTGAVRGDGQMGGWADGQEPDGAIAAHPPIRPSAQRRTLLELLPSDTLFVQEAAGPDADEVSRAWREAEHHLEIARKLGEDVPSRDAIFEEPGRWRERLGDFARLVTRDDSPDLQFGFFPPERIDRDLNRLRSLLHGTPPTLILCDNEGQLERLEELLEDGGRRAVNAQLAIGALDGGFVMPSLRVLTDHEIFRRARRLRRARRYRQAAPSGATGTLSAGDYVVHLDHGIGIYRGIETVRVGEATLEVAVVEYEGGDRLNVPLYRLDQLERYRSAGEDGDRPPPRLHRLGGSTWQRVRERTRQAIKAMAAELLDLYARRQVAAATPVPPDTRWQRELESSFLYEDTPDQRKATVEVKADMERPRPMDRLLVGDVGYGKTEVAVRAAFKAVQGGKQAAVLVPTTILAEQHGRTFLERLADYPGEGRGALALPHREGAEAGAGAARRGRDRRRDRHPPAPLEGRRVQGPRPAHRGRGAPLRREAQGAAQAAPPLGARAHAHGHADSPDPAPLARRPPRPHADRDAPARPLARSSRSSSRGTTACWRRRSPASSTAAGRSSSCTTGSRRSTRSPRGFGRSRRERGSGVAHGQMPAEQLEEVMRRFVAGEVDLLVSTMIVESGLDVPNANTMVIHDAHRFGLAQLYQLRGRVGRSHRRAYCYLLVPDTMDAQAEERLKVLEHHTDLGAGYRIALKDLELRGAGNLLGAEQSGHAHAVGFDLYMRWLEETVRALQGRGGPEQPQPPDVVLDRPAQLPDGYVPDDDVKLDLYRRLARSLSSGEIDGLRDEMRERFGPLPPDAETLLDMARLRVTGAALGLQHVLVRGDEARLTFRSGAQPRLAGLTAALDDVQLAAEVRRTVPLSLRLVRLGGEPIVPALVRALRQ